jgi:phage shock protein E
MLTRSRLAAVILAALVSVGGISACSGGSDSGTAGSTSGAVTTVSPSDAVKILGTPGVRVIDVRTPAEYGSGHLPTAVNIDVEGSSFDQQIAGLPKTVSYFVYCHSGNRSGVATSKMAALGFTSVYNLQGGIAAWQANGGTIVTK